MPFDTMDAVSEKLAGIFAAYMKENRLELGKDIFFLISADRSRFTFCGGTRPARCADRASGSAGSGTTIG
jgi:hypothetical protein